MPYVVGRRQRNRPETLIVGHQVSIGLLSSAIARSLQQRLQFPQALAVVPVRVMVASPVCPRVVPVRERVGEAHSGIASAAEVDGVEVAHRLRVACD